MSALKAESIGMPLSTLPESRYYIDVSGVFYRISESGKAYVAYCPAGAKNVTIPATIPAEDGGTPIMVSGVDIYAFRQATVSALTFAAPENITVLGNFAFFGTRNLDSINGKGTDEEFFEVLNHAAAGMQLFIGTKIETIQNDGITDVPLTEEANGLKLRIETVPARAQGPRSPFLTPRAACTAPLVACPYC